MYKYYQQSTGASGVPLVPLKAVRSRGLVFHCALNFMYGTPLDSAKRLASGSPIHELQITFIVVYNYFKITGPYPWF